MAETLAEWLAALLDARLDHLARHVVGVPASSRALTERAVAQRLSDPRWVAQILEKLGARAEAAFDALARASSPVLRVDLVSLAADPDGDPVESLEDHGLIAPVRTGRGMPTHVRVTPGLEEIVRDRTNPTATAPGADGSMLGGARRRFDLALLVGLLAHHPPRMTRDGRLHAADLAALTQFAGTLVGGAAQLERKLSQLVELGALTPQDGRLRVVPAAATDSNLFDRLALAELEVPALPEAALALVARLVPAHTRLPLRAVLESAQDAVLRDRAAHDPGDTKSAARGELAETLSALLGLAAVLVLDERDLPVTGTTGALIARLADGARFTLALESGLSAALRKETVPLPAYATGHVQSSFEIVADTRCNPAVLARIGLGARLERADQAAVMRLDKRSIATSASLGHSSASLLADLATLGGREVPANVATHARDWHEAAAQAQAPTPLHPGESREALLAAARRLLALD